MNKPKLGDILLEANLIDEVQMRIALEEQKRLESSIAFLKNQSANLSDSGKAKAAELKGEIKSLNNQLDEIIFTASGILSPPGLSKTVFPSTKFRSFLGTLRAA